LSAVCGCLFNIFTATLHIEGFFCHATLQPSPCHSTWKQPSPFYHASFLLVLQAYFLFSCTFLKIFLPASSSFPKTDEINNSCPYIICNLWTRPELQISSHCSLNCTISSTRFTNLIVYYAEMGSFCSVELNK